MQWGVDRRHAAQALVFLAALGSITGALGQDLRAKPHVISPARFPNYATHIPPSFRGQWDEIVSDGCADREARYGLSASQFSEFEVLWDVTKVKRYSPTEIDIYTTTEDDQGRRVAQVWGFRLIRNGKALVARTGGGPVFKHCPYKPR